MSIEHKAKLWDECLKQNIFSNCRQEELSKVQELFEQTIEENKDVNTDDFIAILGVKIKQMSQLSYKDLIPTEKQPIINFSDNIEEEPLKDIDKLIEAKQKERQNDEPIQREAIQREAIQREPIQRQAIQREPIQREPIQREAIQREPIQREPIQREPIQREAIQPISNKSSELIEIKQIVKQQNIILEQILEAQIKILKYLQKK